MNFKKWVKSIQTAGYNGARTVITYLSNVYFDHSLKFYFSSLSAIKENEVNADAMMTKGNLLRSIDNWLGVTRSVVQVP